MTSLGLGTFLQACLFFPCAPVGRVHEKAPLLMKLMSQEHSSAAAS